MSRPQGRPASRNQNHGVRPPSSSIVDRQREESGDGELDQLRSRLKDSFSALDRSLQTLHPPQGAGRQTPSGSNGSSSHVAPSSPASSLVPLRSSNRSSARTSNRARERKVLENVNQMYSGTEKVAISCDYKGNGFINYPSGVCASLFSDSDGGFLTQIFSESRTQSERELDVEKRLFTLHPQSGHHVFKQNRGELVDNGQLLLILDPLSIGTIFYPKDRLPSESHRSVSSKRKKKGADTLSSPSGVPKRPTPPEAMFSHLEENPIHGIWCTLTQKDGVVYDELGHITRHWIWDDDGQMIDQVLDFSTSESFSRLESTQKATPNPSLEGNKKNSPQDFRLNGYISVTINSRDDIVLSFRAHSIEATVNIGKQSCSGSSYLEKAAAKDLSKGGKLIIDTKSRYLQSSNDQMTNNKRLQAIKKRVSETPPAEKHHAFRPGISIPFTNKAFEQFNEDAVEIRQNASSLANTTSVPHHHPNRGRKNVFDMTTNELLEEINHDLEQSNRLASSMSSTIRPLDVSPSLRANSGQYRGITSSSPLRQSLKLKLPLVTAKDFDSIVVESSRNQLLVITCTASWSQASRRAEQAMEEIHGLFNLLSRERQSSSSKGSTSQSSSVSLPRMGEAMQKVVDILHAVPPESISFSKFNLSASPLLLERYRAQEGSAPIFLMYYNGKLVFAGTEMNGLGYKREDCARQIVSSFTDAKRGKTLPPTFQFDGGTAAVDKLSTLSEQTKEISKHLNQAIQSYQRGVAKR